MHRKIIPDVVGDQELVQLPGSASVREAAEAMTARNIGSVLITKQDRLEGIFTERDLVVRVVAVGLDPEQTTLQEVMTPNPDTIAPSSTALEALRQMDDGGYRHLPVVVKGRLVAIVSRRDFFGAEKARLEQESDIWEHL